MKNFTLKDISSTELKNFFNIFGFVKISNYFSEEISIISKEFNNSMNEKFGIKRSKKRNYFYPQFIEHNKNLTSLLEKDKISILVKNLLGEKPIYSGSDGNIFTGSSPWHRDYLLKQRSLKMLCYLDPVDSRSGALRVIPGSHFVDDNFSCFLGDGLTWPEPPFEGGYDEKGFFGKGHNPTKYQDNSLIPSYVVETKPGDVIVFNHNIIHCTNYVMKKSIMPVKFGFKKQNIRRMFGIHFFSNPDNIKDLELKKEIKKYMEELFIIEMKSFKQKSRFGHYEQNSKSEIINSFTKPIRHLSLNIEENFEGAYSKQSKDSLYFNSKNKGSKYDTNQILN